MIYERKLNVVSKVFYDAFKMAKVTWTEHHLIQWAEQQLLGDGAVGGLDRDDFQLEVYSVSLLNLHGPVQVQAAARQQQPIHHLAQRPGRQVSAGHVGELHEAAEAVPPQTQHVQDVRSHPALDQGQLDPVWDQTCHLQEDRTEQNKLSIFLTVLQYCAERVWVYLLLYHDGISSRKYSDP